MKKSWICLLVLIISLFFIGLINAEVRINELELNPLGSDSGTEWVELYSPQGINLNGWKIINNDNQTLLLNQTINGYFIINLQGQWLDNSNEKVFLYNENELIDETILLSDSNNDNKTWQFCNENWSFISSTKSSQNICSTPNPPQNNTQHNNTSPKNNTQGSSISLSLDWNEDDIINGEEFSIEVSAENLEDKEYDIKIWIEDDGTIISDRYGEDNDGKEGWTSGRYLIYNLFKGPGDQTEDIKLRIREDYADFSGDFTIHFKLADGKEIEETIEILKKEEDKVADKKEIANKNNTREIKTTANPTTKSTPPITSNVIRLGSSESKETIGNTNKNIENSNLIYESKNEKIKIYAIVGFALLCLGLAVLMIFKKIK